MIRERIVLKKKKLDEIEDSLIIIRHIERYALIRQWLSGVVIDCACGVGYGTYLCSKNPDVKKIIGVDVDETAIDHARTEFSRRNTKYFCSELSKFTYPANILLSLETIEHLKDPEELKQLADRCGINDLIISFPTKKTTHYNPYHFWDFNRKDIENIFTSFTVTEDINLGHEVSILKMERI